MSSEGVYAGRSAGLDMASIAPWLSARGSVAEPGVGLERAQGSHAPNPIEVLVVISRLEHEFPQVLLHTSVCTGQAHITPQMHFIMIIVFVEAGGMRTKWQVHHRVHSE